MRKIHDAPTAPDNFTKEQVKQAMPTNYLPLILFEKTSPSGKTKIYYVTNYDNTAMLGVIKWVCRWRCYGFHPEIETFYEQKCLRHIAMFCENETIEARRVQGIARAKPIVWDEDVKVNPDGSTSGEPLLAAAIRAEGLTGEGEGNY